MSMQKDPAKLTTDDIGLSIHDVIAEEYTKFSRWIDDGDKLISCDSLEANEVDASDPSNLKIYLPNGQKFIIRIFAGVGA